MHCAQKCSDVRTLQGGFVSFNERLDSRFNSVYSLTGELECDFVRYMFCLMCHGVFFQIKKGTTTWIVPSFFVLFV